MRTWITAAVLVVAALGFVEMRLRGQGFTPSASIDSTLWAAQRQKVYLPGRSPLVLVGSSRVSAGFDPRVFEELHPDFRAVMLARAGRAPPATLIDLAQDPDFSDGVVLVSMLPEQMTKRRRKEQRAFVTAHKELTSNYGYIDRFANRMISAHLADNFAFRSASIDVVDWGLAELGQDTSPKKNYIRVHADTSRSIDYSLKDVEAHRAKRLRKHRKSLRKHPAPKPKRWLKGTREIERAIQQLVDKGVRVVVIRYPTCGEHYDLDQRHYPRDKYWDRFAARSSATTIHFADYESLRAYECPDGSHLDFRDVPSFTKALTAVLEQQGVLPPGS